MVKRIKTGLHASLLTAAIFSILLAASVGTLAVKGEPHINLFFESAGIAENAAIPASDYENGKPIREVIPGGMPFGVKMYSGGPVADDFAEIESGDKKVCPARDAGIKKGDVITEVDGRQVQTAEDVVMAIDSSSGQTEIRFLRDGEPASVKVTPVRGKDGKMRIGLLIKDCCAGIGTVTFIVPETGEFMGLGHGICDTDTGKLVPLLRGVVCGVNITGAEKGESGEPGELKGTFLNESVGVIRKNSSAGVVGFFSSGKFDPTGRIETVPVGGENDLQTGEAYILSTVGPGGVKTYTVSIKSLPKGNGEKNFELRITDPELIKKTGGIVQGMSGSPIIQNGRLVGAVTHVMINDPLRGYGILIDEMLSEALV